MSTNSNLNKFFTTFIIIFFILYASYIRPEPPKWLKNLLKNDIVRLLYIFLLAYIGDYNIEIALIITVVFLILNALLNDYEIEETYKNVKTEIEKFKNLENFININ